MQRASHDDVLGPAVTVENQGNVVRMDDVRNGRALAELDLVDSCRKHEGAIDTFRVGSHHPSVPAPCFLGPPKPIGRRRLRVL